MVCSICGSTGVNKSSCPLYVKNPTNKNWQKHPNALKKNKFINSYSQKYNQLHSMTENLKTLKNKEYIILTGKILSIYGFKFRKPKKFKIKINDVSKLLKYITLYHDIYKKIKNIIPNRIDYFTNPDVDTKLLLNMLSDTKFSFIQFLINNYDNGNGGSTVGIDLNRPFDEILEAIKVTNTVPDINLDILNLPKVPYNNPKIVNPKVNNKIKNLNPV